METQTAPYPDNHTKHIQTPDNMKTLFILQHTTHTVSNID